MEQKKIKSVLEALEKAIEPKKKLKEYQFNGSNAPEGSAEVMKEFMGMLDNMIHRARSAGQNVQLPEDYIQVLRGKFEQVIKQLQ